MVFVPNPNVDGDFLPAVFRLALSGRVRMPEAGAVMMKIQAKGVQKFDRKLL